MKRVKIPTIVESQFEPKDTNCIWKNGEEFKEFKNGEWVKAEMFGGRDDTLKDMIGGMVHGLYKFSEPVSFKFLKNGDSSGNLSINDLYLISKNYNPIAEFSLYVHDCIDEQWVLLTNLTSKTAYVFSSGSFVWGRSIDAIAVANNQYDSSTWLGIIEAFDDVVGKSFSGEIEAILKSDQNGILHKFSSSNKVTKLI